MDPDHNLVQQEALGHLAINDTFRNRLLTRAYLKYSEWFGIKKIVTCWRMPDNQILKAGYFTHLTEAATMEWVANHTSIPVPKVHCAFIHKDITYIVSERIEGTMLCNVMDSLSEEDLNTILAQLRTMLDELRSIPPPPGTGVQSCIGGSMYDSRILHAHGRFGPFKTINEFHSWIREGTTLEDYKIRSGDDDPDYLAFKHMLSVQDRPWSAPVFTHGDMNPSNVLVRGTKVVGIIDWEFAGWMPPYWEYTSANYVFPQLWRRSIPKFLDPWPEELKMERTRQRWFGDFGTDIDMGKPLSDEEDLKV